MDRDGESVRQIRSTDGATVTVHSCGAGPGVVILHGAGVSVRDYQRLADRWAPVLTVHRYNRRGHPDSAPLTGDETAQTDLDDLAAVLRHTGATRVFGHSGGGFVAMRAALTLPVQRVSVFDPAVAVTGVEFPRSFLEPFERAVAAGDAVLALTLLGQDLNRDSTAARLPLQIQKLVIRGFRRTPPGRQMAQLLPTIGPEVRRILAVRGPAADYAAIPGDALIAYGGRSPRYLRATAEALAAAIPTADVLRLPKAAHNAANIARPWFAEPFAAFFTRPG